jgi:hypothetical protein
MRRLSFLLFLLATQGFAQMEKVLVPIYGDVVGANGTLWSSYLLAQNENDQPVVVEPFFCYLPLCNDGSVPPHGDRVVSLAASSTPGRLAYVSARDAAQMHFSLTVVRRSSDGIISRVAQIPVVREENASTVPIFVMDVPISPGSRELLRVYDLGALAEGALVEVRFLVGGGLLGSTGLSLRAPLNNTLLYYPGYAQLGNFRQFLPSNFPESSHVTVEIRPMTPGLRFWAMATVTDNSTSGVMVFPPN